MDLEALTGLASFYKRRHDVEQLRARLESSVHDFGEYTTVLARFIHGRCLRPEFDEMVQAQLNTPELRALHNEFLRAILHNAHFSIAPPPNVPRWAPARVTRPAPPVRRPRRDPIPFASITAIDLRRLPLAPELERRMAALVKLKGELAVDAQAARAVLKCLQVVVALLLRQSCQLQTRGLTAGARPRVTVEQLLHATQTSGISSVMSPMVVTKYSLARPK
jgi:hypothetical protein